MNRETGRPRITKFAGIEPPEPWPRAGSPDVPTPARLRAWADWLQADGRKPIGVTVCDGNAWLASYLLRRIADALERASP